MNMRGAGGFLALFAVVALAACGSSKSTASPAAQSQSSSTSGPKATTAATASVVMTAPNATLGTLLVDSAGKTLYALTDAAGKPVACTGQCQTFWPPLFLPSGTTTAKGATGVSALGTVSAGGQTQVTDNGLPLYRFSGDAAAGDAHGQGISSFGGTWHVVKAAASGTATTLAPSSAPSSAPAATSTTAGGYGY
jgi:predicted lipoprotein with Yx(FWY)xxD motif